MAARNWDFIQREEQRLKIHFWKPWSFSTGPVSTEGLKRSKMNATRHGLCSEKMLNLRKHINVTSEIDQFEKSAKKYIIALKAKEFEDIERYDKSFRNGFERLKESWEKQEDSKSKYYRFLYVTTIYQKVLLTLSKALSDNGAALTEVFKHAKI